MMLRMAQLSIDTCSVCMAAQIAGGDFFLQRRFVEIGNGTDNIEMPLRMAGGEHLHDAKHAVEPLVDGEAADGDDAAAGFECRAIGEFADIGAVLDQAGAAGGDAGEQSFVRLAAAEISSGVAKRQKAVLLC